MNQKKSGSCRCICRKSCIGRSSCNDITNFSYRCCNVWCLVETALLGLEVFCWRFSEAEFPLDARVTPVVLDLLVSYDSAVGPSIQARDTGCSGEEKRANSNLRKCDYLDKEKEIMSLTLGKKMILKPRARIMCIA